MRLAPTWLHQPRDISKKSRDWTSKVFSGCSPLSIAGTCASEYAVKQPVAGQNLETNKRGTIVMDVPANPLRISSFPVHNGQAHKLRRQLELKRCGFNSSGLTRQSDPRRKKSPIREPRSNRLYSPDQNPQSERTRCC